jgi:hypothetical protein
MNEDQETNMVSGTWGSDSPMLNIDPKAIKMWRLGRLIALIILVVGAAATHILLSLRTDFFADTTAATIFLYLLVYSNRFPASQSDCLSNY